MIQLDSPALIKALGIEGASLQEQEKILEMAHKRLQEVVLFTLVQNLTETEARVIREELAAGVNLEEKVTEISARIPGFAEKLERAVTEEIRKMREALAA